MLSEGVMKRLLASLTSLTLLCSAAHAQDREQQRDHPDAQRTVDWDQINKRIESAVARGEMSRDQANAKYTEIKRNLAPREAAQHDQKHDRDDLSPEARLKMLLGRLVESKQISREVAVQIHQLAFESHEEGPGPKQHEHLERLGGELERLIDRAHHELKAIEETRERFNAPPRRWRGENNEPRSQEQEARLKGEVLRRAEMQRDEAMKRQQVEMHNKAEAHAREMREKHMNEEKKQQAEAREQVEMEHKKERERLEKEKAKEKEKSEKRENENDKKRVKEEKKDRD